MVRQVKVLEPAQQDLEDIWRYVAQYDAGAATKLFGEINKKFVTLSTHPHMGRRRDRLLLGLRSFPVKNYIIFYQPLVDGIEVLRILHSSRNIDGVFERFYDSL